MPDRRLLVVIMLILLLAGCLPGIGLFGVPVSKSASSGDFVDEPAAGRATPRSDAAQQDGPIYGTVLNEQGHGVVGVPVSAYFNNSTPLTGNSALIGNAGSGLAGNSGGAYRVLEGGGAVTVKTDANGHFAMKPPQAGKYNLEAVVSENSKAWRAAVDFKGGTDKADAGQLQLAPTGSIVGNVQATDQGVTNFQNTQIYIPGSGYQAVTGPDGTFRIPHVPVGKFRLHAFSQYLGDADTGPDAVPVVSGKDVTSPPLVMLVARPELSFLTRSGTELRTDNAGAGAVVVLHGRNFGKTRGAPFDVLFNGASAAKVTVTSDEQADVTVPASAQNGDLYVRVGFNLSNHLPFRVIRSFKLLNPSPVPASGSCAYDFAPDVQASDGQAGFSQSDRLDLSPPVYQANIAWRTTDPKIGIIGPDGRFSGITTGDVQVMGQAGPDLPALATVRVTGPCSGTQASPGPAHATSVRIVAAASGSIYLPPQAGAQGIYPTTVKLTATVVMTDGTKGGQVTWNSSDPQIANVDATGLVQAGTKVGMARITATSSDGKATASYDVTVTTGGSANLVVD